MYMEIYNKMDPLINKYCYGLDNPIIRILTDDKENDLIKYIKKSYKGTQIGDLVDDYDPVNIIIITYNGKLKQYDANMIKFMNEYIERKKVFMLIVPVEFDFDDLVKNVKANSIDAISWHEKNGKKYKDYIVVVKKN